MFHLERGILFTLKEAVVRPGKAALDYISGKRIRYYNVFYLCLLALAVNVLCFHFYDSLTYNEHAVREDSAWVDFIADYLKVTVFAVIPLLAFNGWAIFRRLKLNVAEHHILAGMSLLGILIFTSFFILAKAVEENYSAQFGILKMITVLPILLYPGWTYRNATKGIYRFPGFLWRVCLFLLLTYFEIFTIAVAIAYFATNNSPVIINL